VRFPQEVQFTVIELLPEIFPLIKMFTGSNILDTMSIEPACRLFLLLCCRSTDASLLLKAELLNLSSK